MGTYIYSIIHKSIYFLINFHLAIPLIEYTIIPKDINLEIKNHNEA